MYIMDCDTKNNIIQMEIGIYHWEKNWKLEKDKNMHQKPIILQWFPVIDLVIGAPLFYPHLQMHGKVQQYDHVNFTFMTSVFDVAYQRHSFLTLAVAGYQATNKILNLLDTHQTSDVDSNLKTETAFTVW